jgi:signal transduction histidine kinase/ActR/RegA family two-component response regulator/uncharacterized membrane protein affecting hemolysin expression
MNASASGTPIRRRMIRAMLLASGAVLLLTALALFTREFLTYRDTAQQQLATLGRVIAANSTAALAFDNRDDAEDVLAALRADPNIIGAALYDKEGRLFAAYPPDFVAADLSDAQRDREAYAIEGAHLIGYQPVLEGKRAMGTLVVRSDMRAARARLLLYGQLLVGVIAVSGLLAYLMSRRLQRGISAPLLALADAAVAVSRSRNYTLPLPRTDIAEINQLTDAFAAMLTEIRQSEERMRGQLGALSLLQRITHAIGMRQDLNDVFEVVLRTLEEDLPLDVACVCLRAEDSSALTVASLGPTSAQYAGALGLEIGVALPDEAAFTIEAGRLIYEADTTAVSLPLPSRLAAAGLRSVVLTPLTVENHVFGVLLCARRGREAFSSPECEFLRQLGDHVALAAHQARLHGALKQAYDDLRQSQNTVLQQERLRALGQMASGIAHDINNAISPVSLYTESLLEREPNLSPRARDYLTTIQRAIEDVAGTVARMREFYRPRETQLTLARVDVNRMVQQVIQLTQARWSNLPQERGAYVELRTELSTEPVRIMAAEGELRDALTNLIFNAVDAMPDGGTLTLRTRAVAATEDGWPRVEIEVSDTGIGMNEETRRRCLEPFFTTKGERGTGLGLAMVYGAIQRHSAELGIDSEPGRGSTFRLSFAASGDDVPAAVTPLPRQIPSRQRVLVVDDDPVLIKSLCDILDGDGHYVSAVGGGQAGIDAFGTAVRAGNPFTLVITDLGMPHVDGRRVAAAVKALSPLTPVLMLTGWGQRLLAENDVPPHVDVLLSKPPRVAELRAAILRLTESAVPAEKRESFA